MSHLRLTPQMVEERARRLKRLSGEQNGLRKPVERAKSLKNPIPDDSGTVSRPPKSKYRAVKTEINGILFASKKEANRYSELLLLQRSGEIRDLKLQPRIDICSASYGKVCTYVADFFYTRLGLPVYEDVKGMKTPMYRLKRKLVRAFVGIDIVEI